jgi:hypothetical protein
MTTNRNILAENMHRFKTKNLSEDSDETTLLSLDMQDPRVLALAQKVAEKQYAMRKAGDTRRWLIGDYNLNFWNNDFVRDEYYDANINDYIKLIDRLRAKMLRNKV